MDLKTSQGRRSVTSVLEEARSGRPSRRTFPTGFAALDRVFGGGLRTRNLTLVGGAPGAGKTITTLQWARNIARDGGEVVFACYEHDESTLLSRLLHLELGELTTGERLDEGGRKARIALGRVESGFISLHDAKSQAPIIREAEDRIGAYSERLWLVRASGEHTTLDALTEMVSTDTDALFVDYLQKVPLTAKVDNERERLTIVSQGLKELAMSANIAVVAVAAASAEGLESPRLRLHHLRGSSALVYEADVVVLLNDKYSIVSRSQIAHNLTAAEGFKNKVVFTVAKNRDGSDRIDLEFQKQYEYLRVNPAGGPVVERLIDDKLFTE